jgi:hypothetical protein
VPTGAPCLDDDPNIAAQVVSCALSAQDAGLPFFAFESQMVDNGTTFSAYVLSSDGGTFRVEQFVGMVPPMPVVVTGCAPLTAALIDSFCPQWRGSLDGGVDHVVCGGTTTTVCLCGGC